MTAAEPGTPARLVAVTEQAATAIGGTEEVRITHFPFRVGRERRAAEPIALSAGERRQAADSTPLNDLYLRDQPSGKSLHVSGEHFAIERDGDRFFVVDRNSAGGTIVAGRCVGGNRKGGRIELRDGDEIVIGTRKSQYVYRFQVM